MSSAWQVAILVYAALGTIFIIVEHNSYDWDFNGMKPSKIILNMVHQLVHYSRCMIVWPWYLVEDFLLYIDNRDFDDSNDDTDGMVS